MTRLFAIWLMMMPFQVQALTANELAVVVNEQDPNSLELGQYYLQARDIPAVNLVKVSIPLHTNKLTPEEFALIKQKIDSQLSNHIQAVLFMWTAPYAVNCNSITSAYTMGYDASACGCSQTKQNIYFDSASTKPYANLNLRISMLLPTDNLENAKELIDRGKLSGFSINQSSAYLLTTSDAARSTRSQFFLPTGEVKSKKLKVHNLKADQVIGEHDVMFYFTGLANVNGVRTLTFMPGAVADHLTSFGGDLSGESGQMTVLRWLEAGATASYGTVSEPCNYWQKFSNPLVLMKHYLRGETVIESYWKSVAWPMQGLFVGEPLAAPYVIKKQN